MEEMRVKGEVGKEYRARRKGENTKRRERNGKLYGEVRGEGEGEN